MHLPYCDPVERSQPDQDDDFEREWRFAEPMPHDGTGWGVSHVALPKKSASRNLHQSHALHHTCAHLLAASTWHQRDFYEEYHDQELGLRPNVRVFGDICTHIAKTHGLDLSDVSLKIDAGEVWLEGTVATRREKCILAKLVWSVRGVRDVHNFIRIRISPLWEPRVHRR